jgi:transcriptional regulator with GAF, ATPase, and Fis domain
MCFRKKKPRATCEKELDSEQLERTRNAIHQLVEEIVDLQSTLLLPDLYFRQFLSRVLTCLTAPTGAVWHFSPGTGLKRIAEANFDQPFQNDNRSLQEHEQLLRSVLRSSSPVMLLPHEQVTPLDPSGPRAANSTDYFLFLVPFKINRQFTGLLEVFQHADRNPNAQKGFFQFVQKMASLASKYYD